MQTLLHSVPYHLRSVRVLHSAWSTNELYGQLTLLQILKSRTILSGPVAPCTSGFKTSSFKTASYGMPRAQLLRAFQTRATTLEEPKVGAPLVELHKQEEVKRAMAEYLELTLRVQTKLALEISENSPVYIDGLVNRLKTAQKDFSPDPGGSLNVSVKELLAKSKFKGVEPYLESIGVNPDQIEKVSEYARSGIKGVLVKVDLLKTMGITADNVPRILSRYPRFLSNAVSSHQFKVQYLANLGLSAEEICKIIATRPSCLSLGLKDGSLPVVKFLKKAGVKDQKIGKVLLRCPQLLTMSIERTLQPAVEILRSVGITDSCLARVLVTQPSLLRRRLERNIAFCREFGLDVKPGVIARLLVTCPNFSVDGCKARVNYLTSIGLTKEQVVYMISKNAAFMSLNVQTSLIPKVDYLLNVMGRPVEELVNAATFLTVSLENRIKPRYNVLKALKEAQQLTRTYSLNTMVTCSEDDFFKKFVEKSPRNIKELWISQTFGKTPAAHGGIVIGDILEDPVKG